MVQFERMCVGGHCVEIELPEIVVDDLRIGKDVMTDDGTGGKVLRILRWSNGDEMMDIGDEHGWGTIEWPSKLRFL